MTKNIDSRDKATIRSRLILAEVLELSDWKFKITMIDMLMEKSGQYARKDENVSRDGNSTKESKVNAQNKKLYNRDEKCL